MGKGRVVITDVYSYSTILESHGIEIFLWNSIDDALKFTYHTPYEGTPYEIQMASPAGNIQYYALHDTSRVMFRAASDGDGWQRPALQYKKEVSAS